MKGESVEVTRVSDDGACHIFWNVVACSLTGHWGWIKQGDVDGWVPLSQWAVLFLACTR